MNTITKLSQDVTQYYKNITSPIDANARIQSDIQSWTVQKALTSHEMETWELSRGAGRIWPQTVCRWLTLLQRISNQQLRESTSSNLRNLDMRIQWSQKLLNEWCGKCQVACIDKHTCIDKSELKSMYWKLCHVHRHTGADNKTSSEVNRTKPVLQAQITDQWD